MTQTINEKVGEWIARLMIGIGIGWIYSSSPSIAIGWLAFMLLGPRTVIKK